MIDIVEVNTKKTEKELIRLPYKLLKNYPQWVPPLRITRRETLNFKTNPFWSKNNHRFFLANKNGKCVGCIGAFTCREHLDQVSPDEGFFGFIDAEDDPSIFNALTDAAQTYLLKLGCRKITGPFNPSIHYELGILIKGYHLPPGYMLVWQPPYYSKHLEESGFIKEKDFYAYQLRTNEVEFGDKWKNVATYMKQRYSVSLRHPEMKNFKRELAILLNIYNDAFRDHWGFSPVSVEEFYYLAQNLKRIMDPRIILIAERDGEAIGFLLSLPNLNEVLISNRSGRLFPFGLPALLKAKNRVNNIRIITAAIKKEFQHWGIGSLFYPELTLQAINAGYEGAELSWVSEDNHVMNRIAKNLGAELTKTYRIYSKFL